MLKLYRLNGIQYAVRTDRFIAVGTLDEARAYLTQMQDVEKDEVEFALGQFQQRDHNHADFGVSGRVTYTSQDAMAPVIQSENNRRGTKAA
jgi:hypothetical protein